MSRDKKIEEMAKAICSEYDCVIPCRRCDYYEYANCRDVKSAEKLYDAGYRKSTEVAEEIFWEVDKLLTRIITDDEDGTQFIGVDMQKYYALKKKYTEGGE